MSNRKRSIQSLATEAVVEPRSTEASYPERRRPEHRLEHRPEGRPK
jgi:hypothetical protein